MLTLYRRHSEDCAHKPKGRRWKKCQCPIWVQGSLRGETVRRSLNLTSWEAASDLITGWSAAGEIGVLKVQAPTVKEAIEKFFEDAEARHLREATIKKLRVILEKQLQPWCESKGYVRLKQLDVDAVRQFRATWQDSPISAKKKLERLRGFFRFCHQAGWLKTNPVLSVKPPKVSDSPTLPFAPEEMKKILEAAEDFWARGIYRDGNKKRIKALVLLMRYSGLRIRDAVCLERARLKDQTLFLYTQKTGTPVSVPLPNFVIEALGESVNPSPEYFFWNGTSKPTSAVGVWERTLVRLFEKAGVSGGHSHRFRDTFAVSLLEKGVPLETVSILLGHSSIRITEKHYAPWVKSRQVALEEAVRKAWA